MTTARHWPVWMYRCWLFTADDMQSEAASRLYVDAFPNAEFVVIENASHFAFEEQSEAFANIVSEFLNK